MARSPALSALSRIRDAAALCEHAGMPAKEALQRLDAAGTRRRRFGRLAATAGGAALAPLALRSALAQSSPDVAVVGAGLAGLNAATVLATKRIPTQVYDADGRVGGRVASLRRVFPGQVAELGAELIDTTHVTLRGLVTAFGLQLEDYAKQPGAITYRFFGRTYAEAEVVEEYRAFTAAMNADLQRLSAGPTADSFNAFDRILDHLPLSDYLASRGAGALLRSVIDVAYTIEFGRPIDRQSCLSLLFFAQASRRSRFTPFGVFSDERFHVVEGNDAVPTAMAAALPRPVQIGHRLLRVSASQSGALTLAFDVGGRIVERVHRAAVLALPAPLMRQVEFDASVELPESARRAIAGIDYGASTKMMIGFRGRPWYELHASNGSSYSDLPNHQSTWETNPSAARYGDRGVLTDYSGGARAATLAARRTQQEAQAFLSDLDQVWPGAAAYASRDRSGRILAHLTNWSQAPLFQGGYTNNQPGYFTTLEGLYARPARANLVFAGEHTDSFYSYQGFMEGALLSGARAADQIWRATR